MAREHISIYHCDICGKKVNETNWFYWGVLVYERMRSSSEAEPEHGVDCCSNCRAALNEVIKAKITDLKGE